MIYHLTWRKITSPLSGSPLRVRIHLACRDPPRVLGSTSRVGIHLACRGHPLGPAAPRGVPSTLGGSLHARWVPPRSGDPSTHRGSLHVISLCILVVPPHVVGDHFTLVGIPLCVRIHLACQDHPSGPAAPQGVPSTLSGSLPVISLRISVVNHLLHSLASSITTLCLGLQRDVTSPLGVGLVAVFVR